MSTASGNSELGFTPEEYAFMRKMMQKMIVHERGPVMGSVAVVGRGAVEEVPKVKNEVVEEPGAEEAVRGGVVVADVVGSGDSSSVSDSGVSSKSWADMFEEDQSQGSESSGVCLTDAQRLIGTGQATTIKKKYSEVVAVPVIFDTDGEQRAGSGDVGSDRAGTYYKDYVKSANVKALLKFLREKAGVHLDKASLGELSLVTFATGSVPGVYHRGKERILGLATVGDSALALALVHKEFDLGKSVAAVQALKSRYQSNAVMSKVCVASGLSRYLVCPTGINVGTSKVGADFVEAVAGVVYKYAGMPALRRYGEFLQLV